LATNNRLINGPVWPPEILPPKPYRSFAYNADTGASHVFTNRDEYYAALASGDWVDTPAKVRKKKLKFEEPEPVEIDQSPQAVIDAISKPVRSPKKYLSQMNVDELILEGFDYGIDFSDRSKTRAEMRMLIEKAKK